MFVNDIPFPGSADMRASWYSRLYRFFLRLIAARSRLLKTASVLFKSSPSTIFSDKEFRFWGSLETAITLGMLNSVG